MELNPYVQGLRDDVVSTADYLGGDARDLVERLTAPLDSAIRLSLLEVLSAAAAEITRELAPGSVELRLQGRDPEFVVTAPAVVGPGSESDHGSADVATWVPVDGDDATMTRINLRLAQDLKDRVEEAARQSGLSVNAWLVRSASATLAGFDASSAPPRAPRGGDRYTGWVR
jgi:hypothetical protein